MVTMTTSEKKSLSFTPKKKFLFQKTYFKLEHGNQEFMQPQTEILTSYNQQQSWEVIKGHKCTKRNTWE